MAADHVQHVQAWLTKAHRDLLTARDLADSKNELFDTGIYHCQQAAEKALKAWLAFHHQEIQKTHDLEILVEKASHFEPLFKNLLEIADKLTPYATAYRYPDEDMSPDQEEFESAFLNAKQIYDFVLDRLPRETHPTQS